MAGRVISAVLTLQDRDFSSNLRRANDRADDLGRGVQAVGNRIQRFASSASESFGKVSKKIAGVSFAALGVGAAAATATVVSSVIEMDDAMGRIIARTGTFGSELKGIETAAKDVFKAGFGESLTQVADDVSLLSTMFDGLEQDQLTNLALGAATLGKAWDLETKEIGRAVSVMTKTFDDLSESQALDLMTVAFQETGDQADDLLDTFSEYSTQFKTLGYDGEGFTATLIAGAKAGVFNFDKLADSAKEGFLKLSEGSKDTTAALKLMGLDASQITSDISQGGDKAQQAFIAVSTAIGTIKDPAERNAAAIAAFGTPLEDLGPQFQTFFSTVNQDMGNFEGATARAADAMQNSFGARMTKVWRELQIGIADVVSDGSGKEFMDTLATGAENLVPKIQGVVEKALEFGNTIRDNWTPIKETVIGIGTAVGTFAVVMGGLKIIAGITTLIQGLRTALAAGTVAQWAMNTAMLANPLGLIAVGIAGVVTAGVLLYRNFDTVMKTTVKVWGVLKNNPLAAIAGGPFTLLIGAAATLYKNFDKIKENFNKFKKAITNFKLPKWVSSIGSTISSATTNIKNAFSNDGTPSYAVGTNYVPNDQLANIHKGEMVIPATSSEKLRQQGININNIDKVLNKQRSNNEGSNVSEGRISDYQNENKGNINQDNLLNRAIPYESSTLEKSISLLNSRYDGRKTNDTKEKKSLDNLYSNEEMNVVKEDKIFNLQILNKEVEDDKFSKFFNFGLFKKLFNDDKSNKVFDFQFPENKEKEIKQENVFNLQLPDAEEKENVFNLQLPSMEEKESVFKLQFPERDEKENVFNLQLPKKDKDENIFKLQMAEPKEKENIFNFQLPKAKEEDEKIFNIIPSSKEKEKDNKLFDFSLIKKFLKKDKDEKIFDFQLPKFDFNNEQEDKTFNLQLPDNGLGNEKEDKIFNINLPEQKELTIPTRQLERLSQKEFNIEDDSSNLNRQNQVTDNSTSTTTTNNQTNSRNNIIVNIHSAGTTAAQVINEIVPQLKLALANM